ncbi:MAG: type IV secretion system protein, partial [Marinomonas sp.]
VAFFAISLMIGRSNLSVRALIPKMMTLGLVLTFATSFAAYQSFFWNIFIGGPDWLAGALTGTGTGSGVNASATLVFAQKLDVVFLAIQGVSEGQAQFDAFSPPGMMWMGALMLLLGTVGILVTARTGLALLLAIGPIFVVLPLFNGTRGLFTGWLKGLVMLAITPVLAVLGGSIMLELAVPVLSSLTQPQTQGTIDPQSAMAFFLIGAVHCALMLMTFIVSAKMVAGWQVFGLAREDIETKASDNALAGRAPLQSSAGQIVPQNAAYLSTAQAAAGATAPLGSRRIDVSAIPTNPPANDSGVGAAGAGARQTKVYATTSVSSGTGTSALGSGASRTRGIGNRFRPARTFSRSPEKTA